MPKLVSCYYYVVSRNCLNKMNINRRAKTRKTTDNNTNLRLESTVVPEGKRGSAVAVQHQGGQTDNAIYSIIHSSFSAVFPSAAGHKPQAIAPAPSDVPAIGTIHTYSLPAPAHD